MGYYSENGLWYVFNNTLGMVALDRNLYLKCSETVAIRHITQLMMSEGRWNVNITFVSFNGVEALELGVQKCLMMILQ
jgi:hypothetical protein